MVGGTPNRWPLRAGWHLPVPLAVAIGAQGCAGGAFGLHPAHPVTPDRVSLWSGPRCRSTAVMYAVAQRPEVEVVDEPLFGHYLSVSGALRPSREEVLAVQDTDPEALVRTLHPGRKVRFFKHMANHLRGWAHEVGTLQSSRMLVLKS